MDGFKRPRPARPVNQRPISPAAGGVGPVAHPTAPPARPGASAPVARASSPAPAAPPMPSNVSSVPVTSPPAAPRRRRRWPWVVGGSLLLIGALLAGAYWWYQQQLRPVSGDTNKRALVIAQGDSVATIAKKLKDAQLIRNDMVLQLYARLHGKTKLQAGTCRLSPSQSTPEIIEKIVAGCRDFKAITFYPGGTLEPSRHKASRSADGVDRSSARYVLQQAGYSDDEITKAFQASYQSPLFDGKPAEASLEGYIFGETYYVATDATAQQVLETVFAHMYEVVKKYQLKERYEAQGLTLYQGIIMASIVERELTCEDKPTPERKERCYQYQRGIAQVFLKRHAIGMQLGSDITAVYAADHKGVVIPKNDVKTLLEIDSPYNTRKYTGMTPTPIATPGELSLRAVGYPTETDHLFFLAGDDGLIYFARTNEEHQANTRQHCQRLCQEI